MGRDDVGMCLCLSRGGFAWLVQPGHVFTRSQHAVLCQRLGTDAPVPLPLLIPTCAVATDIVLVDDVSQLPLLYSVCEVALMGNSLVEGASGHNLAEAAVAGCAILVGPHGGAAAHMADELNSAALVAAEEAAAAVRSTGGVCRGRGL